MAVSDDAGFKSDDAVYQLWGAAIDYLQSVAQGMLTNLDAPEQAANLGRAINRLVVGWDTAQTAEQRRAAAYAAALSAAAARDSFPNAPELPAGPLQTFASHYDSGGPAQTGRRPDARPNYPSAWPTADEYKNAWQRAGIGMATGAADAARAIWGLTPLGAATPRVFGNFKQWMTDHADAIEATFGLAVLGLLGYGAIKALKSDDRDDD